MTHQKRTEHKMKITESRLNQLINECFRETIAEVIQERFMAEVVSEVCQERNAQEKGMSDDEVIKGRIDKAKNNFLSRHLTGEPWMDSQTKKYVNSFPDKDWDWHRLFKHDIGNNHLAGHEGGDVVARYEKRYGPIDWDDKVAMGNTEALQEGVNNQPSYTHYLLNRMTNKIVNGWDYNGTDPADIKYYTKLDLEDMGFSTKDYKFLTKQSVLKLGINPDDDTAWANN